MAALRPLIAGNWKMNGLRSSMAALDGIVGGAAAGPAAAADIVICPPATLLAAFAERAAGSAVAIGAQDCHAERAGVHTGDLSAEMLADAGARFVLVGHSERRADHGETDPVVRAKAEAAFRAGLTAIVCVGESRAERESGHALAVVERQLRGSVPDGASAVRLVIAYEPVWSIGTGLVADCEQIAEMHADIREFLAATLPAGDAVRILYGGSVKPDNAAAILAVPDVNGALVGGASLKAADFLAVAGACLR